MATSVWITKKVDGSQRVELGSWGDPGRFVCSVPRQFEPELWALTAGLKPAEALELLEEIQSRSEPTTGRYWPPPHTEADTHTIAFRIERALRKALGRPA